MTRRLHLSRDEALAAYAAQREVARDALEGAGFGAGEVDGLMAAGRDMIAIRSRSALAADKKPGASRLGGLPDLPEGIEWPIREGYRFDFVAQLRLEDLGALDIHELLPRAGVLSFFAGHDVTPLSEWQLAFRVSHYPPETPLIPAAGDTALRPRHARPPKARGVDFEPVFVLPPPWSNVLPGLTRSPTYEQVHESLFHLTRESGPAHPASGLLGFDRPNEAKLAPEERMLLRLEAGEAIPYDFLESVNLCFVVGERALTRTRFDLLAVHAYEGFQI